MRIKAWSLICVGTFYISCHGPDIGDAWPQKNSGTGGGAAGTALPAPVIVYPVDTYKTTSNIILIRPGAETSAVNYTFEGLSGASVVATQVISPGNLTGLLTLPAGTYGNFTVRMNYLATDGRRSDTTSVNIHVRDFNSGTIVKSASFGAHATCAVCTLFAFFPCPGWSFPFTCPSGSNSNLSTCETDSYQGGGNGWICGTDANENYLAANNSNSGSYLPANTGFSFNWLDSSMNTASSQENHVGGATDEALIFSCRMKFAAECPGADAAVSLFFYPYRDPAGNDNVELRQRDCSGAWTSLASARITLPANTGKTWSNKLYSRLDCLDGHITGYYKSGADYVPMIYGTDNVRFTGKNGWAIGPGGVTTNFHRVASFEWRHW